MSEGLRRKDNGHSEKAQFCIFGIPGMWVLLPTFGITGYLFFTSMYNDFLSLQNVLLFAALVLAPTGYVLAFVINRQPGYTRNYLQEKLDHGGAYSSYHTHGKRAFSKWAAEGKIPPISKQEVFEK